MSPRIETTASGGKGKCPACNADGVVLKDVAGVLVCERCANKRFSSKVRKRIQEAYERQQDEKRREAWVKRMEVAKMGVKAYEQNRVPEALKAFRDYIAVLENRHGVGTGGLFPGLFEKKGDAAEILLIAGIYWDLAKIYDQMKGHSTELKSALNKFIEFSVNRKHNVLSSEALRRYIASETIRNKEEFKSAYNVLRMNLSRCFVASTLFGPDSHEVTVLRQFRDDRLLNSSLGSAAVSIYYTLSPLMIWMVKRSPSLKNATSRLLTRIVNQLSG
jgi:hypothetical protein